MFNFSCLMKCALVAVVLVLASGHPVEKLANCCEKVSKDVITEPIFGYLIQEANDPCVEAVIFQTESGLYCSYMRAGWVHMKIRALRKMKAQSKRGSEFSSSPSPVSLLSIITSTSSPPSSSSSSPSFTSDYEIPSGERFYESQEEESTMVSSTY